MPELPEVETVMRGLDAVMTGQGIVAARLARPDLRWAMPADLGDRLAGAVVQGFRRRGKYILMRLGGGTSVLIHLGMSGRMLVSPASAPPAQHEHVTLWLGDGRRVGFVDPRRFGMIDLVPTATEEAHRLLAGLGPEPLSAAFTPAVLDAALAGRATPIKAALLDQRIVAGLGNIYVAEALFLARLSPRRLAGTVTGARTARLVPAIRAVLEASIAAGGSSLRDYVHADGGLGFFQDSFKVYGRAGQPCERCPGAGACAGIRRVVQAGRTTFHCPRTQR